MLHPVGEFILFSQFETHSKCFTIIVESIANHYDFDNNYKFLKIEFK